MMLKVNEILHCRDVSIDVDEYVPVTVEFASSDPSPPLYWRGGDGSRSLVELGLSGKTGAIRSITLTSIGSEKASRINNNILERNLPNNEGLPAFDLTGWPAPRIGDFSNNFLDDIPSDIWLLIGDSYVVLVFDKAAKPKCFITNGNVRFGVSANGELSTIDIFGLTQQQLSVMEVAIPGAGVT